MGDQPFGVSPTVATHIAKEIGEIQQLGVQLAVVLGGGNLFRGLAASARGMDRATADYMGMLATVINALALQDALEQHGVTTRVVTAIEMRAVASSAPPRQSRPGRRGGRRGPAPPPAGFPTAIEMRAVAEPFIRRRAIR